MASSARSRHSGAVNRPDRGPTPMPIYQPPTHPLNDDAQRALRDLPRVHKLEPLKNKLRVANGHLTLAAAEINDRLQAKTALDERRKARKETQTSQESNEEEDKLLGQMRKDTDDMTENIEARVRQIIDAGEKVKGVEEALKELDANVTAGKGVIAPTQSTLGASQFRQKRQRQGTNLDGDEGEYLEDGDTQSTMEGDGAVEVLKRKLEERQAEYKALSMSHRYASHNDYVGFKKIVHDAHYPEDQAPPMPNASRWFPTESQGAQSSSNGAPGGTQPAEDDDFEVASERITIRCPITLVDMKNPVSSTKCPHSFEREAIMSMINVSDVRIGGDGRRGTGQKAMMCPVCEVMLTAADLQPDPVLVRKIKRIQAAMNAQNDDYGDEDDDAPDAQPPSFGGAFQRHQEVTSSPAAATASRIKAERMSQAAAKRQPSMIPNTQLQDESDMESGG